jgi:hypothetical protein
MEAIKTESGSLLTGRDWRLRVKSQGGIREYDAIVVGSGPGGATVARELSKRNRKVLILERGAAGPAKESLLGFASIANGVSVGDKLATTRAFATGGTTNLYFAGADLPPLDCFAALGIDLRPALEEAKSELPCAPLADELLGAQAIRVRDSALGLGYAWRKKSFLVDQSKCGSGYSHAAKWTARDFLEEAVAAGATLLTRAKVLKVLLQGNRAVGVEYQLRDGRSAPEIRRAYASKTVLAAGALASPAILRDSGIKNVAAHGFYCQPSFVVSGKVAGLKGADTFVGSMGAHLEEDIALGDANSSRAVYRMFMLGNRRLLRLFSHSNNIAVGVVVSDSVGGALRDDGKFHKTLTRDDIGKLAKGKNAAMQIIKNAGGKRITQYPVAAGQCGGLIRISRCVDEHLQTDYNNLHVCDGSVIPENFRLSPTMTLICLGKYLATHLSKPC